MSLGQSNKGIEWNFLIEILLLLVATTLIITIFTIAAGRADDKTSENLCRGFNAIRYATQIGEGKLSITAAPNACKTIDKKDVPSKDYKNNADSTKDGAQKEIRDLMARCWWMWLEGNQKNMFDKSFYNWQNGCFICYTFSTGKDVGYMKYEDLSTSLNQPYYAVDKTDRCAPLGQGGKCMDSCTEPFTTEVPSSKCNPQESLAVEMGNKLINPDSTTGSNSKTDGKTSTGVQIRKCCAAENECENRGGRCLPKPDQVYSVPYTGWACKQGHCYLEPDRMASYLDYIQGTRGAGGGAGKVLFLNEGGINPRTKYAITFVSPGDSSWNWNFVVKAGTAAGAIGAGILLQAVPVIGTVGGLTMAAVASYELISAGNPSEYNYIFVSSYDSVKNQCEIEAGAGEK
ncbi:MAG TPA: hypothetical protein VJJ52_06000 [Candidatus Nanoarchaeia archaeon]|nr:hypothetical protein [Candidatus Nanoarchaeia archaeon]